MIRQNYLNKVDIALRDERDVTLDGIKELEKKKLQKETGSVAFVINDQGIVIKVVCDKILKKRDNHSKR